MVTQLDRLDSFFHPDSREDRTIDATCSLFRGVQQSEFSRVHLQFFADFVDDRLRRHRHMG